MVLWCHDREMLALPGRENNVMTPRLCINFEELESMQQASGEASGAAPKKTNGLFENMNSPLHSQRGLQLTICPRQVIYQVCTLVCCLEVP